MSLNKHVCYVMLCLSREKSRLLASETLNFGLGFLLRCCRSIVYLWRLMLTVTGEREAAFLLKTVKRMLHLGYVLLHYVLIYN